MDDVTLSGFADKARARRAFKQAFKEALAELGPRDQALLRYRYVDGQQLAKIAAIWGIHHATVLRRLDKLRKTLVARTQTLLMESLGVRENECRSLLRLLKSDVDLTLHTFLSDGPPESETPP